VIFQTSSRRQPQVNGKTDATEDSLYICYQYLLSKWVYYYTHLWQTLNWWI